MNFILRNPDIQQMALSAVSQAPVSDETPIEVIVRPYKSKRSLEQNALWHTMVGELAQKMGYTPIEMKGILKYALGYYHEIQGKQRKIMIFDETSKMSVEQLTTLIDQTYQWASEKGVVLK